MSFINYHSERDRETMLMQPSFHQGLHTESSPPATRFIGAGGGDGMSTEVRRGIGEVTDRSEAAGERMPEDPSTFKVLQLTEMSVFPFFGTTRAISPEGSRVGTN